MPVYQPGSLYFYKPSLAAAIVCAVLFSIIGTIHAWQTLRHKSWRITSPLVVGALELVAGFIIRALASNNYTNLGLFIGSEVCIIVAPPVLALTLYLTLGRTFYYIPYLAPIHPGRVRTTFVGFDIVCGALLGSGAARFGNTTFTAAQRQIGVALIEAGMVLQCVLMVCFIWLTVVFHRRCLKKGLGHKVQRLMIMLYACSTLILARSIFRTIEFFQGYTGVIYTTEVYFYCCDILFVIIAFWILHILHPGKLLPVSNKVYLAMDGETEKEGPGWVDNRHFMLTLFDPFDLVGLCRNRDAKERFWESDAPDAVLFPLSRTSQKS